MSDGRSTRKSKVVAFVDGLSKDRQKNLHNLIEKSKLFITNEFEKIKWSSSEWKVTSGRLVNLTGKNTNTTTLKFHYSPSLGGGEINIEWSNLIKALFLLRYHRKYQAATNQRNFINACGYVSFAASELNLELASITPQVLDLACSTINDHYSEGTAYNLHKAVAEFAGHCDANKICRISFKYKYSKMKRPKSTGGINYKRLDDPEVLKTTNEKILDPEVFKILGELYRNVPKDHKYRFYVLILSLLACTGRRMSELSLLPYQIIKKDSDGREYLEYFPRKISKGDTFTPKRKLYLPTAVLPLVKDILKESDNLCSAARETAEEMHRVRGPDLRILSKVKNNQKIYSNDLHLLGIPKTCISSVGWIRKNAYVGLDHEKLTKQGIKPSKPMPFTFKSDVIKYFTKDYSDDLVDVLHIDQHNKKYFLKDMFFVRHRGISSGFYASWLASQCTHSMMTTFLRYFPALTSEYASSSANADFTSHHFRHTLNTLLDEGGLTDLLQTQWFGRANPEDTKAYQHTSPEKRALMVREALKNGDAGGSLAEQVSNMPLKLKEVVIKARVQVVLDVGTGSCTHHYSQTPCPRHLQCSASCDDYVWLKDDKSRLEELKKQFALTMLALNLAEEQFRSGKKGKSQDWILHTKKKIKTLKAQLEDNGIIDFDYIQYLERIDNDE